MFYFVFVLWLFSDVSWGAVFFLQNPFFESSKYNLIMNKKQIIFKLVIVAALLLAVVSVHAADWLFRDGKSSYQIVVSAQASSSEQTAARELQHYIRQVSGVELPITSDLTTRGRSIYVGFNPRVAALSGALPPQYDDESFTYRTVGHDLLHGRRAQSPRRSQLRPPRAERQQAAEPRMGLIEASADRARLRRLAADLRPAFVFFS